MSYECFNDEEPKRASSSETTLGLQPVMLPGPAESSDDVRTDVHVQSSAVAERPAVGPSALQQVLDEARAQAPWHVRSAYAEAEIAKIRASAGTDLVPVEPAPTRASWHDYFMEIATTVASRSTCDRKHVGCVLIAGNGSRTILATGYNGSLRSAPHCDDVGHDTENGSCQRTTHAESNAIAQAARQGARLDGSHAYVTASPCRNCLKLLISAGIERIYCGELYRDDRIFAGQRAHSLSPRRVERDKAKRARSTAKQCAAERPAGLGEAQPPAQSRYWFSSACRGRAACCDSGVHWGYRVGKRRGDAARRVG